MMQDTTNGIDPYECELEDGVPGWLYALLLLLLFVITFPFVKSR